MKCHELACIERSQLAHVVKETGHHIMARRTTTSRRKM